jgi:hypothetical protein
MQTLQAFHWLTPAICDRLPLNGYCLPVRNATLPNRDATVWLYPNLPSSRNLDQSASPFPLDLEFGATLAPPGPYARDKPLLGMQAIRFNKLRIRIDGDVQRVSIELP